MLYDGSQAIEESILKLRVPNGGRNLLRGRLKTCQCPPPYQGACSTANRKLTWGGDLVGLSGYEEISIGHAPAAVTGA